MKLIDLTQAIFTAEMQQILVEVRDAMMRLKNNISLDIETLWKPTQIIAGDDSFPFPLAADLWDVWQYGTGEKSCPPDYEWRDVMQTACELLWKPLGTSAEYQIPADFWQSPLGMIFLACEARDALADHRELTVDQLSLLASVTRQAVHLAIKSGQIDARKDGQIKGKSGGNWYIAPNEVFKYLDRKAGD